MDDHGEQLGPDDAPGALEKQRSQLLQQLVEHFPSAAQLGPAVTVTVAFLAHPSSHLFCSSGPQP